ncbi:CocE/NonD family hydrolase [Saccharomonospora sp. NPDC006951]
MGRTESITVECGVAVPMRDGTVLRADVWHPGGRGPHPAILIRTPYGRSLFDADALRPEHCVRGGYVCVVQDARGRGDSGGDWVPFQWEREGDDTYDSVEWVAGQPWCDGAVGMCGASYLGIVQWLGAAARPPHLRAIAPGMTTSGELELAEAGGALRLNQLIYWLALTTLEWLGVREAGGHDVDPAIQRRMLELLADPSPAARWLPLKSLPRFDFPESPFRFAELLTGALAQVAAYDYDSIEVPTLSLAGWYDIYCAATIRSHERVRDASAARGAANTNSHHLMVGPWTHDGHLPAIQGQCNFGPHGYASFADVPGTHLAFFDTHLRNAGTKQLPPVRYFVMGAGEWRTARCWPPPGIGTTTWYLASDGHANGAEGDGRLEALRPAGGAEEDTYRHDPGDPVPTHGGNVAGMGTLVGGPLDQTHIEARPDVLCYTSAPLNEPFEVIGSVTARLFVATSAHDADVVVKLVDVAPRGPALVVTEGILRLRYRDSFHEPAPAEPGTFYELAVNLRPTAWRFHTGHRIRLAIAGSDFPQYDLNTGTGNPLGDDAEAIPSVQRVRHTASQPSTLLLSGMPVNATSANAGSPT